MKKFSVISLSVIILGVSAFWIAYASFNPFESKQEYMDLSAATEKWGKKVFDEKVFKDASADERAKMVVDLIRRKLFIGSTIQNVKSHLGENTGYFWSDQIPAYLIEEGWNRGGDTWQVVFLPGLGGKIKDVKIHKNCCSKK